MRSKLVTAGLVAFLILASAGLGLVIGGSSSGNAGAGGGGSGGNSRSSTSEAEKPPRVVVRAVTFILLEVYAATNGTSFGVFPFPRPLASLRVVFTQLRDSKSLLGHLPFFALVTNSSGIGEDLIPLGNYSVVADGPNFNFTATVSMRSNTTTLIDLTVEPAFYHVTTLEVNNPDSGLGIEPDAQVSAELSGKFQYSPATAYQVIGDYSGTQVSPHGLLNFGVEVEGTYPALGGTWVQMKSSGPFTSVPTSDIMLVQYLTNSTVSYISD